MIFQYLKKTLPLWGINSIFFPFPFTIVIWLGPFFVFIWWNRKHASSNKNLIMCVVFECCWHFLKWFYQIKENLFYKWEIYSSSDNRESRMKKYTAKNFPHKICSNSIEEKKPTTSKHKTQLIGVSDKIQLQLHAPTPIFFRVFSFTHR